MILSQDNLFLLKNENISMLLRVTPQGLIQQLHFGNPISEEDADALACQPGLGWGTQVLLEPGKPDTSPDALPLAWSGCGRGDYRESPIDLLGEYADFRYAGYEITQDIIPFRCGLPQALGKGETLRIHMEQPGMELELYFTLFDDAITRRTVLKNTGSAEKRLGKLMSFSMDLPGRYEMRSFTGGWIAEMRLQQTGSSSNRCNPGFLLSSPGATEEAGNVYGFNLIYSGNHYASAQRSLQELTRVMQGISPANFCLSLAPGGEFETPEAVMTFSDRGFGGLSRRMHRFVNRHIIPAYWQGRPRPVLYNDWKGCGFDFNQQRLVALGKQAAQLGCELFVLDDGWFGQRNNDLAGLGDYNVNKKKLPDGLSGLAKKINALGMEFGLWFESEAVNPDSDLYRAHPDWAIRETEEPLMGRNELLLDLSMPEVRDYIVESVGRVLDSANITYVKWDMNRHSTALGVHAHQNVLGLYDILRRIFQPRPHILLEGCSSGGNRFDLGMLCFAPQIWCSDDTDPIERLTIQGNLSYLYPQSTFGTHVSAAPHAQTLRATPLTTRGNVSFFGLLGYELDLKHLLPVEQKEIAAQIAFYKAYREVFQFGTFHRLENGWQVSREKTHIAGVFYGLVHAAPGYDWLKLRQLEPDKRYAYTTREQKLRIGQFGCLVNHVSPVPLDPNGIVLRTADRHFNMEDGAQDGTATGIALMTGIPLLPLFRGTGYDTRQRSQGDFGSNVYIIEE